MHFKYFEPASTQEAVDTLRQGNGDFKALAGGTDVIIHLRRRARQYRGLVNIKHLPAINEWAVSPGGGLAIGAAVPFRSLELSPFVRDRFPMLIEAIQVIGSLQLRNQATIGGNVCNASPSADSAPALIAAGATATYFEDGFGERTIPIGELFVGPGVSILGASDILLQIEVPGSTDIIGGSFERLTPRSAMDIAIVSSACQLTLGGPGMRIQDVAVVLGAVAPTPIRAQRAEEILRGHEPTAELMEKASAAAMDDCNPISDIRGGASYRKSMVEVLVRRTLGRALKRAEEQM